MDFDPAAQTTGWGGGGRAEEASAGGGSPQLMLQLRKHDKSKLQTAVVEVC